MSIGNLKDTGNQGNNFPWQLKVLQGLQCICDELKEININTDDIETLLQDIIDQLLLGLNVTVVNGAGAAAVNIQDGGNVITVDAIDLDIRNLNCDDIVSLCFNNAGISTTVSDINPLPVNATITIPNPLPVILPTGTVTASLERITTGSGTVATGAYSVSFFNAGDQTALVAVQPLNPGERVTFTAPEGKTLGPILYNVGLPLLGEIRDLVISKVI